MTNNVAVSGKRVSFIVIGIVLVAAITFAVYAFWPRNPIVAVNGTVQTIEGTSEDIQEVANLKSQVLQAVVDSGVEVEKAGTSVEYFTVETDRDKVSCPEHETYSKDYCIKQPSSASVLHFAEPLTKEEQYQTYKSVQETLAADGLMFESDSFSYFLGEQMNRYMGETLSAEEYERRMTETGNSWDLTNPDDAEVYEQVKVTAEKEFYEEESFLGSTHICSSLNPDICVFVLFMDKDFGVESYVGTKIYYYPDELLAYGDSTVVTKNELNAMPERVSDDPNVVGKYFTTNLLG